MIRSDRFARVFRCFYFNSSDTLNKLFPACRESVKRFGDMLLSWKLQQTATIRVTRSDRCLPLHFFTHLAQIYRLSYPRTWITVLLIWFVRRLLLNLEIWAALIRCCWPEQRVDSRCEIFTYDAFIMAETNQHYDHPPNADRITQLAARRSPVAVTSRRSVILHEIKLCGDPSWRDQTVCDGFSVKRKTPRGGRRTRERRQKSKL